MSRAAKTFPAIYEDLLNAPEHLVAEIIDDQLITSPRPTLRHAGVASFVQGTIHTAFDRRGAGVPGGWLILFEPELHIVGQVIVPDIAGWRSERLPEIPDSPFLEVAPDWICEILSPSTMALDRTRKMHHYARAGLSHLWLLDPQPETLEVYRLEHGGWKLVISVAGADSVRAEPFEAIEMEMGRVWAR